MATPEERVRAVAAAAEELKAADVQIGPDLGDGRRLVRILAGEIDRQALLDRLQAALGKSENWRIVMLPTDTAIPREPDNEPAVPEEDAQKAEEARERASREELYNLVAGGARIDTNFLLLVFLSTVVASVGLEQDSVAVIIGAMVIAPLLGPNVAFAFGAAIGDRKLERDAAAAAAVGIVLSIVIAAGLAAIIPVNTDSRELMSRTSLDYAGLALALASGAAAALSVTTGLSSTLVGVMVAVALLPPAATCGIMMAAHKPSLAIGAALLLVANVACVSLAAQVVFLTKGIKPRLWHEQKSARRAVAANLVTWIVLILVLGAVIAIRQAAQ